MQMIAGCKCPQCRSSEAGMMQYTGRDKTGPNSSYQRILKCNECGWEATEDKVRHNN
jgi:predicted Zn-ribbon and HTH transcriptional regulator